MTKDKLQVLLTTEGTYPFHQGGVSTWCDLLVQKLGDVDFTVYSVMMNPFVSQIFNLPDSTELIKMPLWGTEEPSEHLSTPFSIVFLKKQRTSRNIIAKRFIPLFREMILEFLNLKKDPYRLGEILLELHHFFREYEYKVSFKSEETWDVFKEIILEHTNKNSTFSEPDLYGLIQSLGWVYRFLNILNTPIPRVHVTHATAAAFCGIPCVLAKLEYKTPFLLTEHGVYLREQYLSLAKRKLSSYLNTFLIRFIHSITALNYTFADQVSPVCHYNTRWEKRFGVPTDRIDVIYNGIDKSLFKPINMEKKDSVPTVVTVARIDPIKDILTLIEAANIVKKDIPNVRFRIYGSISVPAYYEECKARVKALKLEGTIQFEGHTSNIMQAYHVGDVVALSSISEAFPYSVIEAMMSGKAVVSTDVGGIGEALGDTGILIEPGQPQQLAEGLLKFLLNPRISLELGEEARRRALDYFTLDQVLEHYYRSYVKLSMKELLLSVPHDNLIAFPRLSQEDEYSYYTSFELRHTTKFGEVGNKREFQSLRKERHNLQKLWIEKGLALAHMGDHRRAIAAFELAIPFDAASPVVPMILSEIAELYNQLGEYDRAINEMEKMYTFLKIDSSHLSRFA